MLVGGAALVVYLLTLAPTVTAEDSGELISAAWCFGVPHPPGYPLWTMLCGAFVHLLPFGEEAWRANLFSAVGSAAAAGVAFLALRVLSLSRWSCAAGALTWVLGRWSWSQSVITEVYALNSLITAGLLLCALKWYVSRNGRYLLVASFLFGIGVSHHQVVGLAALGLIIWILLLAPNLLGRWKLVLASLLLFAGGLSPYLYLPIRAATDPPLNWGDPIVETDPEISFWDTSFVKHITRHQYGAVGPAATVHERSFSRLADQLAYVGGAMADDLTLWGAALGVVGMFLLLFRDRKVLLLVLLWLACTGALFAAIANFDLDHTNRWVTRVFLIPASLGLVIPLAYLLDFAVKRVQQKLANQPIGIAVVSALAAAHLPILLMFQHWSHCNYRDYYFAEDHGRNLLNCMEQNAVAFCSGDHNTFPILYLQQVKGERTDVTIADPYGFPDKSLFAESKEKSPGDPVGHFLRTTDRPAYFTVKESPPVPGWTFQHAGLLYRFAPPGTSTDAKEKLAACQYRNLDPIDHSTDSVVDLGASHILFDNYFFRGLAEIESKSADPAVAQFDRGVAYVQGIREPFNNVGSALAENGHTDESVPFFQAAAEIDSTYKTPRRNLFKILIEKGDNEKAWNMLMELQKIDAQDARLLKDIGWFQYTVNRDANAALKAWSESLRQNPHQPDVIQTLNNLYQSSR